MLAPSPSGSGVFAAGGEAPTREAELIAWADSARPPGSPSRATALLGQLAALRAAFRGGADTALATVADALSSLLCNAVGKVDAALPEKM